MKGNIMRFLGDTKLLQLLNTNDEPKKWLIENSDIIKKNFTDDKVHCVTKVSFSTNGGKVDPLNAAVTFVEAGDSLIKEENLMTHLQGLFEKEKGKKSHEILIFYGRVDDTKQYLKTVAMAGVIAREQEAIKNLPEELRR